jgi:hypothetical protein
VAHDVVKKDRVRDAKTRWYCIHLKTSLSTSKQCSSKWLWFVKVNANPGQSSGPSSRSSLSSGHLNALDTISGARLTRAPRQVTISALKRASSIPGSQVIQQRADSGWNLGMQYVQTPLYRIVTGLYTCQERADTCIAYLELYWPRKSRVHPRQRQKHTDIAFNNRRAPFTTHHVRQLLRRCRPPLSSQPPPLR